LTVSHLIILGAITIFSIGFAFAETESTEKVITIRMNGPSIFYFDEPNQIIRASVEIQNYTPSDGQYYMKVIHLPTNKVRKDFEIFPKPSGNDLWAVQIAYPILESDIKVGPQTFVGEYEIHITSDYGSQTASTKFSILESSTGTEPTPTSESKITIDANINKNFYKADEKINVTGKVSDILYGNEISFRVIAPNGNTIAIDTTSLDSEGFFSYYLDANSNLFDENGEYVIQLMYGTEDIRKEILFSYMGNLALPKPEPAQKPETTPEPEPTPESTPEPEPTPEPTPAPIVEPTQQELNEKKEDVIGGQSPIQKNEESSQNLINILPYLGIVIAGVIGGIIVIKKRNKGKGDDLSENYDYNVEKDEPKDKMKWEGI
jgi:hypothetical protein